MELSETSSNLSYMTSSAFAPPKRRGLDVIKENEDQKDDEEESESSLKGEDGDVQDDGVKAGEKVKTGVKKYVKGRGKKHIVIDAPANLDPAQEKQPNELMTQASKEPLFLKKQQSNSQQPSNSRI